MNKFVLVVFALIAICSPSFGGETCASGRCKLQAAKPVATASKPRKVVKAVLRPRSTITQAAKHVACEGCDCK